MTSQQLQTIRGSLTPSNVENQETLLLFETWQSLQKKFVAGPPQSPLARSPFPTVKNDWAHERPVADLLSLSKCLTELEREGGAVLRGALRDRKQLGRSTRRLLHRHRGGSAPTLRAMPRRIYREI